MLNDSIEQYDKSNMLKYKNSYDGNSEYWYTKYWLQKSEKGEIQVMAKIVRHSQEI